MLHRACAHPAQGPGAVAEAQTLAMAMGLVAAVLGGAVQVRGEARALVGVGWGAEHCHAQLRCCGTAGCLAWGPCSVTASK